MFSHAINRVCTGRAMLFHENIRAYVSLATWPSKKWQDITSSGHSYSYGPMKSSCSYSPLVAVQERETVEEEMLDEVGFSFLFNSSFCFIVSFPEFVSNYNISLYSTYGGGRGCAQHS